MPHPITIEQAVALLIAAALADPALAESASERARRLDAVQVSARAEAGDTALAAEDTLRRQSAAVATDPVDWLRWVPGVTAQARGNYAQDLQLSVRGHGSRSSFGVRSLRLYVDGLPASAPDGQGQLVQLDPFLIDEIRLLRGPLAALYGQAAGGVLRVRSRDLQGGLLQLQHDELGQGVRVAQGGSSARGDQASIALGHWQGRGPRPHSEAERSTLDLHWRLPGGEQWTLDLRGNAAQLPEAQDPLGLTQAQYASDPFAASPQALAFDSRKSVQQAQLGGFLQRDGERLQLELAFWGGRREVEQFLAVPSVVQRTPSHGGGVIDLQRDFHGLELSSSFALSDFELSLGLRSEQQDEIRRGFENFRNAQLGVRGALRRDERNRVRSLDPLLLLEWQPGGAWQAFAGLRHSRLDYRSRDRYVAVGNPDDSGARRFSALLPAAGAAYVGEQWQVRASVGRGFEAPTGNELAYRSDAGSGFNTTLRPARSRLREIAVGRTTESLDWELTLFHERVSDELIVLQSSGGRSVFGNAPLTRRQGVELSADWALSEHWSARIAATTLDARFVGGALDRRRLPAVPARSMLAGLDWRANGWLASLDLQHSSGVAANDSNSVRSDDWRRVDLRLSRPLTSRFGIVDLTLAALNLFDATYVGSVIVNEANGRFLETAAGRRIEVAALWRW